MKSEIPTQVYRCGPYTFTAFLPTVGSEDDAESWAVRTNGVLIPGRFGSLEDAMTAAAKTRTGEALN